MEDEQSSYQSEPEITESHEQEQLTETTETVTTQEEVAPKGFNVKYNKEDRFIPESEATTYIQKGLNYDKVNERAQQLEGQAKYLERQAKISGFTSVDEYMKALDAYEQQQTIEQEAQRMNVDPETYAQYFQPVNQKLQQYEQELTTLRQQQEAREQQERGNQAWGELYKEFPSLADTANLFSEGKNPEWFNTDMQQMLEMGYQPLHAYKLANQDSLFKQREQEVLARVTARDGKQVLPSIDSPNNAQVSFADMSFDEIQKISERVRRGERITG